MNAYMQWALGRQLLFALGTLALLGAIGFGVYATFIYTPATCFDNVKNQDEEEVDCGGVCALLCKAPQISVVWARPVKAASGVFHGVAMVRNPDTESRGSFSYEVSLFDEDNLLIARRPGTFSIGPGEVVPLFEANIIAGERIPSRVFVDIRPGTFERATREVPPLRVVNWELNEETRRLSATIQNYGVKTVSDARVTALIFNESDTLISASQTLSGTLAAGERKAISFTWQEPFSEPVSRVDIVPHVIESN